MTATEPRYYSSLRPFERLFQSGVPILTYHKVGPRPRRVRIKGLYVSADLLARQLAELRQAGFGSQALQDARPAGPMEKPSVVLTFDDGFRNVVENALEPLARNQFRAIQFLVADLVGKTNEWEQHDGEAREPLMDGAQVREWLAAGHEIGSHTLTHPRLTRLALGAAREEITASKKALEDRFGRAIEHFCYPYGDWNEPVRDLVGEAGYVTACTTVFGVNSASTGPHELRRITARYPTLKWATVKERLKRLILHR
jgi:peptidoglycan/xylan/chitin deacetylase (PgdA/CDA1 family)